MDEKKTKDPVAEEQNLPSVLKNESGNITYANEVVAIIAGIAATEVAGIAGMSGGITAGIAEMLGRKNLTKGVKVEVGNEEAAVDLFVVVDYGVRIQEVCVNIQENVKKAIETMTGLRVIEVNVFVQGIRFEKETKEKPVKELEAPRVR